NSSIRSICQVSFQPSPLGVKPFGITRSGSTVTSTESRLSQPLGAITETVNHVVIEGSAIGLGTVGLESTESGHQMKFDPSGPVGDPPSVAVPLAKMLWSSPASATGGSSTTTATSSVSKQFPSLTVRVKMCTPGGKGPTIAIALSATGSPFASVHWKLFPPTLKEPFNSVRFPGQIS